MDSSLCIDYSLCQKNRQILLPLSGLELIIIFSMRLTLTNLFKLQPDTSLSWNDGPPVGLLFFLITLISSNLLQYLLITFVLLPLSSECELSKSKDLYFVQ